MQILKRTNQHAADLHWLAFLLTGCRETGLDVVVETIAALDAPSPFLSTWMLTWSRRVVIAKALAAIREDLAASARRTQWKRADESTLPPRTWVLDRGTTKGDLERALVAMDSFPRAAVLLLVFERVSLEDAAILMNAGPDLVRKGQITGLQELTASLATMQGWTSTATEPTAITREMRHA